MSTPAPAIQTQIVSAAAPSLIAVLQAIIQFEVNIGPDPLQWPVKVKGAFDVLLGTIELQIPGLVAAEAGAIEADVNSRLNAWIAKLKTA